MVSPGSLQEEEEEAGPEIEKHEKVRPDLVSESERSKQVQLFFCLSD